ncbi:hypothetical protein HQ524_01455 [Candidatus Uhrbacteria bacterium]|nr:hypothetical protein [Candidatus Uhrbacteria bacterium]
MKNNEQYFEVRVGRVILSVFLAIAFIFLFLGLDLVLLHSIIKPEYVQEAPMFAWVMFAVFFIIVPCLIIWKMLKYLAKPPVMLHIDHANVTFGTWFGYKPHSIPTKYLKKVGWAFRDISLTDIRPEGWVIHGGLGLTFEENDEVPFGMVTSAGVTFSRRKLKLAALYMNTSVKKAIEGIKPFVPKTHEREKLV